MTFRTEPDYDDLRTSLVLLKMHGEKGRDITVRLLHKWGSVSNVPDWAIKATATAARFLLNELAPIQGRKPLLDRGDRAIAQKPRKIIRQRAA